MVTIQQRQYWYGEQRALERHSRRDLVNDSDGWWAWGTWDGKGSFHRDAVGERLPLHEKNGSMYLGELRVLTNGELYEPKYGRKLPNNS